MEFATVGVVEHTLSAVGRDICQPQQAVASSKAATRSRTAHKAWVALKAIL